MKVKKRLSTEYWYGLKYYNGSLDFPCDFCNSNSYANYHIMINYDLVVICEKCLAKEKGRTL